MIPSTWAGYLISFFIHGSLLLAVGFIPFQELQRHVSVVELDFALAGNEIPGGKQAVSPIPPAPSKTAPQKKRVHEQAERTVGKSFGQTVADGDVTGMDRVTDETGQGDGEGNQTGRNDSTVGGVSKSLNYLGTGGIDERNFSFVRETILQSIRYPERARRMGWEGKVVLSFTVFENGGIGDVRIIQGSGFSLLDENARDTVTKVNIKRKLPVRLYVLLPVEYRLH